MDDAPKGAVLAERRRTRDLPLGPVQLAAARLDVEGPESESVALADARVVHECERHASASADRVTRHVRLEVLVLPREEAFLLVVVGPQPREARCGVVAVKRSCLRAQLNMRRSAFAQLSATVGYLRS